MPIVTVLISDQATLLEKFDNSVHALAHGPFMARDHKVWIGRLLIRRRDARKVCYLPRICKCVMPFSISLPADIKWCRKVNHEKSFCSHSFAYFLPNRFTRGNKRTDTNNTSIIEESCNFSTSAEIFTSIVCIKSEVTNEVKSFVYFEIVGVGL
mgnify:CR=1 FL=1